MCVWIFIVRVCVSVQRHLCFREREKNRISERDWKSTGKPLITPPHELTQAGLSKIVTSYCSAVPLPLTSSLLFHLTTQYRWPSADLPRACVLTRAETQCYSGLASSPLLECYNSTCKSWKRRKKRKKRLVLPHAAGQKMIDWMGHRRLFVFCNAVCKLVLLLACTLSAGILTIFCRFLLHSKHLSDG